MAELKLEMETSGHLEAMPVERAGLVFHLFLACWVARLQGAIEAACSGASKQGILHDLGLFSHHPSWCFRAILHRCSDAVEGWAETP